MFLCFRVGSEADPSYAVQLKQVAHFYNTIHEKVIESQFPMLENEARAFEAVIKHPKVKGSKDGACHGM